MGTTMQHWNGHQLCAIDIETTGTDPFFHEIVQIAILPLDSNIQIRKDVSPLYLNIKPLHPERYDPAAKEVISKAKASSIMNSAIIDPYKAIDLLEYWIKKLNLGFTKYNNPKRIIPLGSNYIFDKVFIERWLGSETYSYYFDSRYRDLMVASLFLNDYAGMRAETVPYSKNSLQWLCRTLDVEQDRAHDALQDCIATAECYRRMLQKGWIGV